MELLVTSATSRIGEMTSPEYKEIEDNSLTEAKQLKEKIIVAKRLNFKICFIVIPLYYRDQS
mgnify:CR=1 FL=1